jgi:hypothetical protein
MVDEEKLLLACALIAGISSCTPAPQAKLQQPRSFGAAGAVPAPPSLPPALLSAVTAAVPDMVIREAERKERDGRVYYDVEGVKADGSEIELDLLQENSVFKVVEIQRDIAWADAPESARAAAAGSPEAFEPVRVIESRQTDGSVLYELFAADASAKPSLEVRVADGRAEVLKEESRH